MRSCFADSVCGLTGSQVSALTYNGSDATAYGYYSHNGQYTANTGIYGLTAGNWAIRDTNGGIIKGVASCNNTFPTEIFNTVMTAMQNNTMTEEQIIAATWGSCNSDAIQPGDTFTPTAQGQYCWCKITSFTPSGDSACNVTTSLWIYYNDYENVSNCASDCANDCRDASFDSSDFRRAMFGVKQ